MSNRGVIGTNDDERSHTSHHQIILDDDDDFGETIVPPSNRSTGGTPLRNASPLISPGGHHHRGGTPLQQQRHAASPSLISPGGRSYEDLANRPRSNPRTRTPMRYESPLSANAFHRREVSPEERREGQRISIQPMAGAAVGTTFRSNRISEQRYNYASRIQPTTTKSSKQGPSHRKVRRWNNDNFVGIASEIAKASSRGAATAELMLQAQADAANYRYVPNPEDSKPTALTTFIQDEKMEYARRRFFEGEIGHEKNVRTKNNNIIPDDGDDSPEQMMNRIHVRLRNVIIRACNSSESTVKIVDTFEECLCRYYLKNGPVSLDTFEECLRRCILENNTSGLKALSSSSSSEKNNNNNKNDFKCNVTTLLEEPKVSTATRYSSEIQIHFHFDASSSDAGFHRLLLHAVCQFHGLNAVSTTVTHKKRPSRQLIVTGKNFRGPTVKLSDQAKAMKNKNHHGDVAAQDTSSSSTPSSSSSGVKTITSKFNTIKV